MLKRTASPPLPPLPPLTAASPPSPPAPPKTPALVRTLNVALLLTITASVPGASGEAAITIAAGQGGGIGAVAELERTGVDRRSAGVGEGFIQRPGAGALFDQRAIEGRCPGDGSGVELRAGAVEGERGGGAGANIQNAVDHAAGVEGDGVGEITHGDAAVDQAAALVNEGARRTAEDDAIPLCAVRSVGAGEAGEATFTAGAPGESAPIGEGAASAEADSCASVAAVAAEVEGAAAVTTGASGEGAAIGEGAARAEADRRAAVAAVAAEDAGFAACTAGTPGDGAAVG